MDALIQLSRGQFTRLRNRFDEADFQTELRRGDADDPIPHLLLLTDAHGNRVDLLGGLRGLDRSAFTRALLVPFMGETLRIAGREDLIAMKCFAGGPQHLIDVRTLIETAPGPIDTELLRSLTCGFGRIAVDNLDAILTR